MSLREFEVACERLQVFMAEQKKLQGVLNVISPSSNEVVEFGNDFMEDYVNVVKVALGDRENWLDWFVWDNDFGKKRLTVSTGDRTFVIFGPLQFYNVCIKMFQF
jgi:hypothetical protein